DCAPARERSMIASARLGHRVRRAIGNDPALASAMQAAGGHWIGGAGPTEKITAVLGDPPKRFGVTEFENIDKAQAWLKSPGREAIAPKRDKAIKIVRQFIFEGK